MRKTRKSAGYELLRLVLPPLEMCETAPNLPVLTRGDLVEAVLLRVDEKTYKSLDSGIDIGEDGIPLTGDPIADEWERELRRGKQ